MLRWLCCCCDSGEPNQGLNSWDDQCVPHTTQVAQQPSGFVQGSERQSQASYGGNQVVDRALGRRSFNTLDNFYARIDPEIPASRGFTRPPDLLDERFVIESANARRSSVRQNNFIPSGSTSHVVSPLGKQTLLSPRNQLNFTVNPTLTENFAWKTEELLQKETEISISLASKLVELFSEGNTIPFIARHRKDIIGLMTTDKLQKVRECYDKIEKLKLDIRNIYAQIYKAGAMSVQLRNTLMNTQNRETLEEIVKVYKDLHNRDTKMIQGTIAKLEESANQIMQGTRPASLSVDVIQLIANKIGCSPAAVDYLSRVCKNGRCMMRVDRINQEEETEEAKKYTFYYNRSFSTNQLKQHQILAINRAEKQKLLEVHLLFVDFSSIYYKFIRDNHLKAGVSKLGYVTCGDIITTALKLSYNTTAVPLLHRMKRTALTSFAEQEALEVYATNLRHMLLTRPVRNKRVLGVDPGTSLGCKLGLVSEKGEVLATGVVYPNKEDPKRDRVEKRKFRKMLLEHQCCLIALGNGTGCRKAEEWISNMINNNYFAPLSITYRIINENGASQYSCSEKAIKEFPMMDPILISAVSLARRLQDPMSELVKVEPKHMGIGMYQHDLDPERLDRVLADVICECVSFVGVDVNTASQCLLRHVAGLSESSAGAIVAYRNQYGGFVERKQIYNVNGINTMTYQQCVGFLRILNGVNKLDETRIHPESYEVVKKIVKLFRMNTNQIGTRTFKAKVKQFYPIFMHAYQQLGITQEKLKCIFEELSGEGDTRESLKYDGLFSSDVTCIEDLYEGLELMGLVQNVTSFGSFVDIGVEKDALLHVSQSKGIKLQRGNRVKVEVYSVDLEKRRIGLKLVDVF